MKAVMGSWILLVGLIACETKNQDQKSLELLTPMPVVSFSGDTLTQKSFPDSIYQVLLTKMMDAKQLSEQYPDSAELAIWYGRRMAYMGRYHEAIVVFTEALRKFPNDYRLLRHRGHRYITTRQIDSAITDYERANALTENAPNAIEPDGIPNKLNKPLSNDKFNIYYHQGLAYYLNGDFEKAIPVYRQCMAVSDNDDLKVATSYWLYMSYIRSGDLETAQRFLMETETDVAELIENDVYLELLQVFKQEKTGEEVFAMPDHPTYQYGVGFYHWSNGNEAMARSVWQKAQKHESWDSFGYIAADAEVTKKGTIYWYQVYQSKQSERILKERYSVRSAILIDHSNLKFKTYFTRGDRLEFELHGFEKRGDSCFHQGIYVPFIDTFYLEDRKGNKSELMVYNYDDPDMSDEESFLFINSKNELIAVDNWTMGPLLILTFDGNSPESIYDFVTSESTQKRIREKRL